MEVLIVYGSKYGSTREVAAAIAEVLAARGKRVDAHDATTAPAPHGYGAVIVGSGVYVGSWLKAASRYVEAHTATLLQRPVWLFGVGPLGAEQAQPAEEPEQARTLVERVGARGYTTFAGALDRGRLNLVDRMIARAVKAPDGDYRDWGAIRGFAHGVADALDADAARPVARAAWPASVASTTDRTVGGRA